ncbi:MAG TPA: hypothetical protein DDZ53_00755 [Firmicutes bacterium]|nr:hypothetical protein [Bacillota bacterium]
MKRLTLLAIGLIPLPLGYILRYLIMTIYRDRALPAGIIGVAFLLLWFCLGLLTKHMTDSDKEAMVTVHAFAFLDLLLVLFQEHILRRYWLNIIGALSQFFFLPLINIASRLTFFAYRLSWTYITAFALMYVVFYLGRSVGKPAYQATTPQSKLEGRNR